MPLNNNTAIYKPKTSKSNDSSTKYNLVGIVPTGLQNG